MQKLAENRNNGAIIVRTIRWCRKKKSVCEMKELPMNSKELSEVWTNYLQDRTNQKFFNLLVQHYYSALVKRIAKKVAKKFLHKIDVDELASHGTIGLYKAIEGFDPVAFKVKFDTYAYTKIWGSIIDQIRHEDWVPRSVRNRQTLLEKTKMSIEAETGTKSDDYEALSVIGFDHNDYNKHLHKFKVASCASIETNFSSFGSEDDDAQKDFNKYLVAKNEETPGEQMLRHEFLSKLMGRDFSPMERKIVYFYYYQCLSTKEMSKKLKLTEAKIGQMHQSILQRMKKKINRNPKYFDMANLKLAKLAEVFAEK